MCVVTAQALLSAVLALSPAMPYLGSLFKSNLEDVKHAVTPGILGLSSNLSLFFQSDAWS